MKDPIPLHPSQSAQSTSSNDDKAQARQHTDSDRYLTSVVESNLPIEFKHKLIKSLPLIGKAAEVAENITAPGGKGGGRNLGEIIFGFLVVVSLLGDFLVGLLPHENNQEILDKMGVITQSIQDLDKKVDDKFANLEEDIIEIKIAQDKSAEAFVDYIYANRETTEIPDSILPYLNSVDNRIRASNIKKTRVKERVEE